MSMFNWNSEVRMKDRRNVEIMKDLKYQQGLYCYGKFENMGMGINRGTHHFYFFKRSLPPKVSSAQLIVKLAQSSSFSDCPSNYKIFTNNIFHKTDTKMVFNWKINGQIIKLLKIVRRAMKENNKARIRYLRYNFITFFRIGMASNRRLRSGGACQPIENIFKAEYYK